MDFPCVFIVCLSWLTCKLMSSWELCRGSTTVLGSVVCPRVACSQRKRAHLEVA